MGRCEVPEGFPSLGEPETPAEEMKIERGVFDVIYDVTAVLGSWQ